MCAHMTLYVYTVICENFVAKRFRFARSDENFLGENSLPVLTCAANILWHMLEVDENIVTRIFLTQKFCKYN